MARDIVRICTFEIGDLRLGLPVEDVLEVVRERTITEVPLAPAPVAGVISLRGEVVTALDTASRLGVEFDGDVADRTHVVVEFGEERYVLLADGVDELVEVSNEDLTFPPTTLERPNREFIDAVVQWEDGWIVVLELERVLDLSVDTRPERSPSQTRR